MRQGHVNCSGRNGRTLAEDLRYDANFRAAQNELVLLLETFRVAGVSLALLKNLRKVRDEARRDYELRDFFGDWRAFLKRCTGRIPRDTLKARSTWNEGNSCQADRSFTSAPVDSIDPIWMNHLMLWTLILKEWNRIDWPGISVATWTNSSGKIWSESAGWTTFPTYNAHQ